MPRPGLGLCPRIVYGVEYIHLVSLGVAALVSLGVAALVPLGVAAHGVWYQASGAYDLGVACCLCLPVLCILVLKID